MYRYLWTNGPKECLEFGDYSFEEHFGKAIPSFPPYAVLNNYILGRAEKSDVRKYVRFNTAVRDIRYSEATGRFTVRSTDLNAQTDHDEEFDHVIVAIGHFSVPNVPSFPGIDRFPGRGAARPRLPRRAGVQGQAAAHRRRELLRRGHRAAET